MINKEAYLDAIGIIEIGRNIKERQIASGSIVKGGRYPLIATAAHCTYNYIKNAYYEDIFFTPIRVKDQKYKVVAAAVPLQFINHTYLEYDTSFLILEESFNENDIYEDIALDVKFSLPKELTYQIFGYPYKRKQLAKSEGKAIKDTFKGSALQGVNCFEKDGMSGGPWITKYGQKMIQNSVSILSFNSVEGIMWGPYWGEAIERAYQVAKNPDIYSQDVQLHYF